MNLKSSNPYYHIAYWIFVIFVITLVFGLSWGNNLAAFFFISMLLPVVLGTSYFFNYFLVPRYFFKNEIVRFGLFTFYLIVVSLYMETIILMFSFIYLGNFSFQNLGPNASDTVLLAVVLYLLVIIGSFILMARQITENRKEINKLLADKEKWEKSYLELMSNRKTAKIRYDEIIYIESLADYIKVNTVKDQIISKEKISNLSARLPDIFIRIHRSFIVNTERIKFYSFNEVLVDDIQLNIGRSYRKAVRESLKRSEVK